MDNSIKLRTIRNGKHYRVTEDGHIIGLAVAQTQTIKWQEEEPVLDQSGNPTTDEEGNPVTRMANREAKARLIVKNNEWFYTHENGDHFEDYPVPNTIYIPQDEEYNSKTYKRWRRRERIWHDKFNPDHLNEE